MIRRHQSYFIDPLPGIYEEEIGLVSQTSPDLVEERGRDP